MDMAGREPGPTRNGRPFFGGDLARRTLPKGSGNMNSTVIPVSERLQQQFHFTRVPNEIIEHPKLSAMAKMIWIDLWKFCYKGDGIGAFPGMARIATNLGTSEETIRKHRRQLEAEGLLTVERRGLTKTNMYRLFVRGNPHWYPEPKKAAGQEPQESTVQERKESQDKEDKALITQSSNKKTRSDKPTASRKQVKYDATWYKEVLDAYQEIRGIALNGPEFSPLQQTIKTIFMAGHEPKDAIGLMHALEDSDEEWTCNWTLRTVKMKLPLWKAGKLTLQDEQARIREYDRKILAGESV